MPLPQIGKIQIMIVLVFILSRYWFKSIILNIGALRGTHMHPKVHYRARRSPKRKEYYEVEPRDGCPIGHPYGCPRGVPIEAHEVWPIILARKSSA